MTDTFTPHQNINAKGIFHCLTHPEDYDGPRFTEDLYAIAVDALDNVHFGSDDDNQDPCCSVEDPCVWAARYLLATGRVAGARGYVYSIPFLRIAEEATGTGAPVSPGGYMQPTEEPEGRPSSGKGTGSGGGRRKSGPKLITDAQYDFLVNLLNQMSELDPGRYTEEDLTETREDLKHITAKQASSLISGFKASVEGLRAKQAQNRSAKAAKVEEELVEDGMYRHDGEIYWLKRAKGSGRLYAKRVVITDDGADLEYAGGVVRRLDPAAKLTSEEALEVASHYGRTSGKCMICSRKLVRKESIERGIGPICEERV